jgi:ribosome-binding ATPase YchF (GTP1/OBG family)
MKLGIIGLSQAGKTTIFNALTRGNTPTTASAGRFEVHTAVVDVPDERVDRLSAMFKPKKTIYAKVTYADIAGLESGAARSGISGQLLNQLTQMDGFLLVVRAATTAWRILLGAVTLRDLRPRRRALLNDLIAVERKLERLTEERKKGGTDKVINERQTALFTRLHEALNANTPLRKLELNPDESRELASFGLLTRKPLLTVFNLGEGQSAPQATLDHPSVALMGKLEMEIAQLGPADAEVFMKEYGIEELSLRRMIRLSYDLLQLQSFFTVGGTVRAWTWMRRHRVKPGAIHATCSTASCAMLACDDSGNWRHDEASGGQLRLDKEYPVRMGISCVRFNL